jgi:hypothetical protein
VHIKRRPTNFDGTKVENRRSPRYNVTVPLEVSWRGSDGKAVKEPAVAKVVNERGGFIEMVRQPDLGNRVTLTNFLSAEAVEARVLATPGSRANLHNGVVVELVIASGSFWGVDLQVKKAAVELQKLETLLRAQGIDLRLLKEYLDAMDFIRKASTVAQELRELQLQGKPEEEVLRNMAAERVRRAMNLLLAVITDLDAAHITQETAGVDELHRSLDQTLERLRSLAKHSEPVSPGPRTPIHK